MGKKRDQKYYDYGYLQALEDVLRVRMLSPKGRHGMRRGNAGCSKCEANWLRGFKSHARHKKTRVRAMIHDYIEARGL